MSFDSSSVNAVAPSSNAPPPTYVQQNDNGRASSRLIWIGVGIVVGLMLVKQLPEARRYLRLERM